MALTTTSASLAVLRAPVPAGVLRFGRNVVAAEVHQVCGRIVSRVRGVGVGAVPACHVYALCVFVCLMYCFTTHSLVSLGYSSTLLLQYAWTPTCPLLTLPRRTSRTLLAGRGSIYTQLL